MHNLLLAEEPDDKQPSTSGRGTEVLTVQGLLAQLRSKKDGIIPDRNTRPVPDDDWLSRRRSAQDPRTIAHLEAVGEQLHRRHGFPERIARVLGRISPHGLTPQQREMLSVPPAAAAAQFVQQMQMLQAEVHAAAFGASEACTQGVQSVGPSGVLVHGLHVGADPQEQLASSSASHSQHSQHSQARQDSQHSQARQHNQASQHSGASNHSQASHHSGACNHSHHSQASQHSQSQASSRPSTASAATSRLRAAMAKASARFPQAQAQAPEPEPPPADSNLATPDSHVCSEPCSCSGTVHGPGAAAKVDSALQQLLAVRPSLLEAPRGFVSSCMRAISQNLHVSTAEAVPMLATAPQLLHYGPDGIAERVALAFKQVDLPASSLRLALKRDPRLLCISPHKLADHLDGVCEFFNLSAEEAAAFSCNWPQLLRLPRDWCALGACGDVAMVLVAG